MRLFLIALLALPLCAQEMNSNQLTVGVGGAAPAGGQDMDPSTAIELNYGHRFTKYIQADVGFETSFNKDYRNYYSKYGTGLVTTTNFFVPAGGRILVPIRDGKIEPFFGLGAAYHRDQSSQYHPNQVGVYGLAGVSYALDSRHKHRVGVTVRYMNFMSAGTPHPQWTNVFGEYTYSWGR